MGEMLGACWPCGWLERAGELACCPGCGRELARVTPASLAAVADAWLADEVDDHTFRRVCGALGWPA